jgi:hypothetical protein
LFLSKLCVRQNYDSFTTTLKNGNVLLKFGDYYLQLSQLMFLEIKTQNWIQFNVACA